MKTLDDYLRSQVAVDFLLRVIRMDEGKPIKATISPAGIAGDPFQFTVDVAKDTK